MRNHKGCTAKARNFDGEVVIGYLILPTYEEYEDSKRLDVYLTTDGGKSKIRIDPNTVCGDTGIEIRGQSAYEYDVFSFSNEEGDEMLGYIAFSPITMRYIMYTNPITFEAQEISKCHNIRYTGRNVKTSIEDFLAVIGNVK